MMNPHEKHAPEEEAASREDAERFTVRVRVARGVLTAMQLDVLREVAQRHGSGFVRLLPQQGVEIPGIRVTELHAAQNILSAAGIPFGSAGPRLRHVGVCSDAGKCPRAFVNCSALGDALEMLLGREDPAVPIKIAISGCPNSCTAPQMADLGFVGLVEPVLQRGACDGCGKCAAGCDAGALVMRRKLPRREPERCDYCGACVAACTPKALRPGKVGYTVYVGGKAGRRPQVGSILARFISEEEAPDLAARLVSLLREQGQERERLSSLLQRMGMDAFRTALYGHCQHRVP